MAVFFIHKKILKISLLNVRYYIFMILCEIVSLKRKQQVSDVKADEDYYVIKTCYDDRLG